jgi:Flp pilus assembly protein TadD
MNNAVQAVECFKKVVTEDVMNHEGWYMLATEYDEVGDTDEAVHAYYMSIQIKPDFVGAYNNLGVLLSSGGRYTEALKVLRNAQRMKPGDTELIFNIGATLVQSGRFEDAVSEFMTCEKLKPDDEAVLYMIAVCLMNTGKTRSAMEYLGRAVEKDPELKTRASKEEVFSEYVNKQEYVILSVDDNGSNYTETR